MTNNDTPGRPMSKEERFARLRARFDEDNLDTPAAARFARLRAKKLEGVDITESARRLGLSMAEWDRRTRPRVTVRPGWTISREDHDRVAAERGSR